MTSRACWRGNVTQEGLVRALASAANTFTACGEGWAQGQGSADTLPLPGWDAPRTCYMYIHRSVGWGPGEVD
jgi:hypothetical protein